MWVCICACIYSFALQSENVLDNIVYSCVSRLLDTLHTNIIVYVYLYTNMYNCVYKYYIVII